jgi:hypothetical protein
MCFTLIGSSLAYEYWTRVEANVSGKTLLYYNMATIMALKSFILEAPEFNSKTIFKLGEPLWLSCRSFEN